MAGTVCCLKKNGILALSGVEALIRRNEAPIMIATLIVLVVFGLLLIMLEAFVPGGILGVLGAISILSAVAVTMFAEELGWEGGTRTAVAIGIIVFSLAAVFVWLRYFAVTFFNRTFNLATAVPTPDLGAKQVIGAQGVAISELRPLGKVLLDTGERREVRLQNGHAPAGSRIQVVGVEPGNLVAAIVVESRPESAPLP